LDGFAHDLVCKAQRGQTAAFAELIRRYERTALAIAYACTGDSDRAADATQEAFMWAWKQIRSLREPGRFGGWLASIVRNTALTHVRRAQCRPTRSLPEAHVDPRPAADPAAQAARRELGQQIDAAIQALDELSRSAVVLRYYQGLSSREIADLLGISPQAVDMRLCRARQELRTRLVPRPAPCECSR